MDHLGVLAGSLSDMWIIARYMSEHAGGDPGCPGLYGGAMPPAPRKPERLIRLDMAGWPVTDDGDQGGVREGDRRPRQGGRRDLHPARRPGDRDLRDSGWPTCRRCGARSTASRCAGRLFQYLDFDASKLPPRLKRGLEEGAGLTQAEYREALVKREYVRAMHEELARRVDGFITLSSPGPGPIGMDQGSAIFNEASSVLGAPAITLPFMAVEDVPVGVQILGPWHGDERLVALGRWLSQHHLGNPT